MRRDRGGDLRLASKLVMWDGPPYLGMTATDASGVVRWSAMIKATQGAVPPGVAAELDGLARQVRDSAPCGAARRSLSRRVEWACSSVVEHCVDIAGVASSILATPTIFLSLQ